MIGSFDEPTSMRRSSQGKLRAVVCRSAGSKTALRQVQGKADLLTNRGPREEGGRSLCCGRV